ncbi:MAG: substrate-binding domain-containing protein [Desulfuromusa sp.]|nr:substrate-binding domain-containing protein [Desulfuromusa sp.]
MQNIKIRLLFILLFLLVACDMQKYPEPENNDQRELLIYSGMTMQQPLQEISALIEKEENCRIKITYGGSGHLLKSVEVNQIGDLFFPGDKSYIDELQDKGIITESIPVGYNEAGLFVQPGNPKQITSDLKQLQNRQLHVVIGTKKAGAIGRETERILQQAGVYQEVVNNSLYMTTDSRGLAQAIKNQDADLVVNWKAVDFLPENTGKMDFIALPIEDAEKQPLVMGLLKYSRYPELARKIMQLASSDVGQNIFCKYGFLD